MGCSNTIIFLFVIFFISRRPLLSEGTLVQPPTISNENLTSIQSNVEISGNGKKVYHFFEGVEKLLEIWFTDNGTAPNATLRTIGQ